MTTKITSIYNAFLAQLELELPDHALISNPYDLASNEAVLLNQAYGLRIGSSSSSNRQTCDVDQDRTFTVVLSRLLTSLRSDETKSAASALTLMEDAAGVLKALDLPQAFRDAGVAKMNFLGDSGVAYMSRASGDEHFLYTELTYELTYFESFT